MKVKRACVFYRRLTRGGECPDSPGWTWRAWTTQTLSSFCQTKKETAVSNSTIQTLTEEQNLKHSPRRGCWIQTDTKNKDYIWYHLKIGFTLKSGRLLRRQQTVLTSVMSFLRPSSQPLKPPASRELTETRTVQTRRRPAPEISTSDRGWSSGSRP